MLALYMFTAAPGTKIGEGLARSLIYRGHGETVSRWYQRSYERGKRPGARKHMQGKGLERSKVGFSDCPPLVL